VLARFLLAALLCLCLGAKATDALAPKSNPNDALVSPLKRIVISSNNLAESKLFYVDGMGLSIEGPMSLSTAQRRFYQHAWQLKQGEQWQLYRLYRAGVSDTIVEIDLVVFREAKPASQVSWNALQLGPLSIGFPNMDQAKLDEKLRKLGFGALNALESYAIPKPDGTSYGIKETIFTAPDFVRAVGVERGNGMPQLGATDSTGMGGPAYAAMVVEDSDRLIAFFKDVLGYELRSDRQWKSAGSKGALNVPDGTEFRFAILYAPAAASGHVLVIDYQNVQAQKPAHPARVGHRGIGMYSFESADLDSLYLRAKTFGAKILDLRRDRAQPALVLEAPNGFRVMVEKVKPR
jgi:catechol 2,3-dioxygenase-like lactoylglutathione lyase family enzyme